MPTANSGGLSQSALRLPNSSKRDGDQSTSRWLPSAFSNGRIIEQGTFTELVEAGGAFAQLADEEARATDEAPLAQEDTP